MGVLRFVWWNPILPVVFRNFRHSRPTCGGKWWMSRRLSAVLPIEVSTGMFESTHHVFLSSGPVNGYDYTRNLFGVTHPDSTNKGLNLKSCDMGIGVSTVGYRNHSSNRKYDIQ